MLQQFVESANIRAISIIQQKKKREKKSNQ